MTSPDFLLFFLTAVDYSTTFGWLSFLLSVIVVIVSATPHHHHWTQVSHLMFSFVDSLSSMDFLFTFPHNFQLHHSQLVGTGLNVYKGPHFTSIPLSNFLLTLLFVLTSIWVRSMCIPVVCTNLPLKLKLWLQLSLSGVATQRLGTNH